MGRPRDWMGLENLCYLTLDAPEVFGQMVDTLAELSCWAIDQVIPRMNKKPDLGFSWEDICSKSGPLVSPDIFKQYVAPGYQKIRNKLQDHGVNFLAVDSDGDITALAQHWFDAGVNVIFPIEIGTWNGDAREYRKRFGKDYRIVGNFDKFVLEKGPTEIDAEIDRLMPLIQEGGFIMLPDHYITPGTSLDNYKYYLDKIRLIRI